MNIKDAERIIKPWIDSGKGMDGRYGAIRLRIDGGNGYFIPGYDQGEYRTAVYLNLFMNAEQLDALTCFISRHVGPSMFAPNTRLDGWSGDYKRFGRHDIELIKWKVRIQEGGVTGFMSFADLAVLNTRVQQLV